MDVPITGLSVLFDDINEQPHYGFRRVKYTLGGMEANLNSGTHGRKIFLCVDRGGGGPPILNLGVCVCVCVCVYVCVCVCSLYVWFVRTKISHHSFSVYVCVCVCIRDGL